MANALQDAALEYAARGCRVFPVTPGQKKPPLVIAWPKRATEDAATIREWWQKWPDANVGIATGKASGFFALDIDPRHGGDGTLADLEARHGTLPLTVEAKTGGVGRHVLFSCPAVKVPNSTGKIGPGLDIRGEGGYIVAPPSVHPSGGVYSWDCDRHPDEVDLAPAPGWLLDAIASDSRPADADPESAPASPATPALDALRRIPEGQRNDRIRFAACSDRGRGASDEALQIGCRGAAARCAPRFPVAEADRIAACVARYPAGLPYTAEDARHDALAGLPAPCREVWYHLWLRRERQPRTVPLDPHHRLKLLPGEVWSTDPSIAKGTGIPERTIARHRDTLKAAGLLEWHPGIGRGNVYRFPVFAVGRPQAAVSSNAGAALTLQEPTGVADLKPRDWQTSNRQKAKQARGFPSLVSCEVASTPTRGRGDSRAAWDPIPETALGIANSPTSRPRAPARVATHDAARSR